MCSTHTWRFWQNLSSCSPLNRIIGEFSEICRLAVILSKNSQTSNLIRRSINSRQMTNLKSFIIIFCFSFFQCINSEKTAEMHIAFFLDKSLVRFFFNSLYKFYIGTQLYCMYLSCCTRFIIVSFCQTFETDTGLFT